MKRSLLVFSFILLSYSTACALENDVAHEAVLSPPQAPNVKDESTADPVDAKEEKSDTEESVQDTEIKEVFVPKPRRHVWKDEKTEGQSESGGKSSSESLTEKLNKINGGGSTQ